ncbi:MAG: fibronectin type III domain-containing protein [Flavobacteriales bacterium]|nr:fibronectin type III domain-containing protein [Flavobacteriales bacterium]
MYCQLRIEQDGRKSKGIMNLAHANFRRLHLIGFVSFICLSNADGQVGIGTFTPDPSAILHMVHTQKGMILTNLTTTQRDAIASPANSLMIFNTTDQCFQVYINGQWQNTFCDLGCSGPPATPGVISGNAAPCENAAGSSYSISQISGATSYTWTVPAGATITGGQGTTAILLDYGSTSGNITVIAGNNCGTSPAQTLAITLQPVPAQPSTITGNLSVCQGDNGIAYAVTNVAGVTYSWSYSGAGFTCMSGCATNSITADYSAGATSGTITVTPSNVCGSGMARTLAVTVNSAIPAAATANAATNITSTDFDANWTASAGVTTYFFDLDDNSDFSSPLVGYNNLNVGNVTTYNLTGLTCGTTYYYRVRASNGCGTSGNSGTVTVATSACGPSCGTQTWSATAINVGTKIPVGPTGSNMSSPGGDQKYCYNDIEANCTTYGGMYEWGEMMDYAASSSCDPCGGGGVQGICPLGYHIPTDLEWSRYEYCIESSITPTGATTLSTFQTTLGYRGTNSSAGPGAKMKDDVLWDGTNTSGFSALPGGFRSTSAGVSTLKDTDIYMSTATEFDGTNQYFRRLTSNPANGRSFRSWNDKAHSYYVRCLQD